MDDTTNYQARNPHLGGTTNPFATNNSSSRNAMWSTNQPQTVTLLHSQPKQISNGADIDLRNGVWDIRTKCTMRIIDVAHKEINEKITDIYLWYQDLDAWEDHGELLHGVIHIPCYHSSHVRYGFTYQLLVPIDQLAPNTVFSKDTVIATSPNVKPDGQYGIGRECNFAFIGSLITHEDGVGMCEEDRYDFQSTYTNETILRINEEELLLNLYGKNGEWQPFPLPGEPVRSDGLLCMTRKLRKRFKPLQMNRLALKDVTNVFDKPRYILPTNEGIDEHGMKMAYHPEVLDIQVIRNSRANRKSKLPDELEKFLHTLWLSSTKWAERILSTDAIWAGRATYTPELEKLIDTAAMNTPDYLTKEKFGNFKQQKDRKVIDEYYIKIITKSTLIPTIGYKFTDLHGGKFVVCGLYPKKDCPTDQWGRHATFWASPESVSNRNNPGQLHEMIYTDSAFHTKNHLMELKNSGASISTLWETYYDWASRVSTDLKDLLDKLPTNQRNDYMKEALGSERLGVYITNESLDNGLTLLDNTENTPFFPPRGPVRYTDDYGIQRVTKANIRISNKYIVLLEKDGGYFSAVAAPKRGPMGISAKLNPEDKRNSQISEQAARVGESEFRNMECYIGPEATARYYSQSNSAVNLKFTIDRMLTTETPSYLPEGGNQHQPTTLNRGVEIFHHYVNCFGSELSRD